MNGSKLLASFYPGCAALCVLLLAWIAFRPAPAPQAAESLGTASLSPNGSATLAELEELSERIRALEGKAAGVTYEQYARSMDIIHQTEKELLQMIQSLAGTDPEAKMSTTEVLEWLKRQPGGTP